MYAKVIWTMNNHYNWNLNYSWERGKGKILMDERYGPIQLIIALPASFPLPLRRVIIKVMRCLGMFFGMGCLKNLKG